MGRSIPVGDEGHAEIVELLHRVHRHLRAESRRELEPLGVTPAQLRALRTIAREAAPMRMSELADRLGVARRSATTFVDRLVDAGLVRRAAADDDRRSVTVAPTAAGRRLLTRVQGRHDAAARSLLAPLGDAERRQLAHLLRRIAPTGPSDSPVPSDPSASPATASTGDPGGREKGERHGRRHRDHP